MERIEIATKNAKSHKKEKGRLTTKTPKHEEVKDLSSNLLCVFVPSWFSPFFFVFFAAIRASVRQFIRTIFL